MQFVDKPLAHESQPTDSPKLLSSPSAPLGKRTKLPRLLLQLLSTHRHLKPAWSVAIAYTIGSFER